MSVHNLITLLQQQVETQPSEILYRFLEGDGERELCLTYEALDKRAREIAARLQRLQLTSERALLLYPPGLEYIQAFWGCVYAGVTAVPAYPPRLNRPMPRLLAVVKDAQARVALTTGHIAGAVEKRAAHMPELAQLTWLATDTVTSDTAEQWQEPNITPDSLIFLQYTSGSTAAPKGVMLSHSNLLHNLSLIHHGFGMSAESRGVIWLPPYHDMGLIGGIMGPLYAGFPVTLMSPMSFLQRPLTWLETISQYRGTISGGPNFAYDMCVQKTTPAQREALDLSSWQVAFNGAEPIRAETLNRFIDAFRPAGFNPEAFYPCYGLAESTLIVSGGLPDEAPVVMRFEREALELNQAQLAPKDDSESASLVSSGRAVLDMSIVIADPETGRRLPKDQVGEIWIAGRSVAQGYWHNIEATQAAFNASLAKGGSGPFLRTGDLGFLREGELFVTGRLKDILIIRGRNYYPQDIEVTIQNSHEALRFGFAAAFMTEDGRLAIAQELEPRFHRRANVEAIAGAIRRAVADEYGLQVQVVLLLRAGHIPKTSSGKIRRHACRDGFADGSLNLVGQSVLGAAEKTAEADEIASIVEEINASTDEKARRAWLVLYLQNRITDVLNVSLATVSPARPLTALGLNRLTATRLKNKLETDLDITVSPEELLNGTTIWQLATSLAAGPGQDHSARN